MKRLQASKPKIALLVLVPYLLLAIGVGFLHRHQTQNRHGQAYYACAAYGDKISSASPGESHNESCAACTWAQSNVSCSLVAAALVSTPSVADRLCRVQQVARASSFRTTSPRAPPTS